MSDCAECMLCCKTHGVEELQKPPCVWCKHAEKGIGCKIYETRPDSCRVFDCVWLQSQEGEHPLPPSLRPDKCKVVLASDENDVITATVDPAYPDAWKTGEIGRLIKTMVQHGMSIIIVEGHNFRKMFNPTPALQRRINELMGGDR